MNRAILLSALLLGCAPTIGSGEVKGAVDSAGTADGLSGDGADGADGSDGADGADGVDGADGSDGGDGATAPSPDTGVDGVTGPPTDSAELFDEARIPEFYLTVSDAARTSLAREPYEYVEATLTFEGVSYGPIGLRTKGENSWRPFNEKSSLKLDFNRYDSGPDRFFDLKGLTFQAMNEDYSMMHERVAYRIYREIGVPAVRAHHAVIYVNDELYGLFTMVDSVDDEFLERNFVDPSGSMWEQHDGEFTDEYINLPTAGRPYEGFFHEEGVDDRTKLQALADALEGADKYNAASAHLDWGAFQRYWAGNALARQFDAYPGRFAGDDCHVYLDPTQDRFVYIPHGVDESFYYDTDFLNLGGLLAVVCAADPVCRAEFTEVTYASLDLIEAADIAAWSREVQAQIQPWVEADPGRRYSVREVAAYQASMIDLIDNTRPYVASVLGPRP